VQYNNYTFNDKLNQQPVGCHKKIKVVRNKFENKRDLYVGEKIFRNQIYWMHRTQRFRRNVSQRDCTSILVPHYNNIGVIAPTPTC